VLVGHSFGGLFAINVLLTHPEYFNAYVANDPSLWWDNEITISEQKIILKRTKTFLPTNRCMFLRQITKNSRKTGIQT
jgi:predicted alpha/beta superfamily hydrolase